MIAKTTKAYRNQQTRAFILEKTGIELFEVEAEEIRQSLVQYCRLLIEISQNQPEEKEHARIPQSR